MADRKPNDVKIVAWLLVAKKLIKFANDDVSYKISDNVMTKSNFDKFPLNKGDKVEVGMSEGVVTFLRKQKSESKGQGSEEAYEPTPEEEKPKAPAPAPKVEEPEVKKEAPAPALDSSTKELTVYAIAANKKVVKFLEVKDAGWFQIDEAIQAQNYKTIGLEAKNVVSVKIVENKVVSMEKVVSKPAEQAKTATSSPENAKKDESPVQAPVQAPKKEWKPYNAQGKDDYWTKKFDHDKEHFDVKESEKQLSIEAQAAVNSANKVAGQVAASISPAPTANVINNMIRAIAEANFALIQELKKK